MICVFTVNCAVVTFFEGATSSFQPPHLSLILGTLSVTISLLWFLGNTRFNFLKFFTILQPLRRPTQHQ